jgi:hypothetical protein
LPQSPPKKYRFTNRVFAGILYKGKVWLQLPEERRSWDWIARQAPIMSGFDVDECDEDTLEISTRCGPVYDYRSQIEGDEAPGGLQCSAHPNDFCFLCSFSHFSEATEPGEEDEVVGIENLITRLAEDQYDIVEVVQAVHKQYNNHIRPSVVYANPKTREITQKPRWSRESIERHITFSSKWPSLFNSIHTNVFRGILVTEASRLMDLDTGEIIEANKDAYFKTIDKYGAWIKNLAAISKIACQPRRRALQNTPEEYYRGPKIQKKQQSRKQQIAGKRMSRGRSLSQQSTRSAMSALTPPMEI